MRLRASLPTPGRPCRCGFSFAIDHVSRRIDPRPRCHLSLRPAERRQIMAAIRAVPPADLELLRRFDTPTVCNVVELFDRCPRTAFYMDDRIKACYPKLPPMVGYAATATFRSAEPPRGGSVYAALSDQVGAFAELPGPAVAVVQDLDAPPAAATLREVVGRTVKAFRATRPAPPRPRRHPAQVHAP